MVKLHDICHARSGDKGDTVNVGLVVYDSAHYEWVSQYVTADAVDSYLAGIPHGKVTRYELPKIGALNFVIRNALGGGASRSLMLDAHGKGFSSILLEMEIPAPPGQSLTKQLQCTEQPRGDLHKVALDEKNARLLRLASGSAAASDWPDPAALIAESGEIDYLIFDSASEMSFVEAVRRKVHGGPGFDMLLQRKLRNVLASSIQQGIKIICNGGGVDVEGAVSCVAELAKSLGIGSVKIGYLVPDNIVSLMRELNPIVAETGQPVSQFGPNLLAAQAYQGAQALVEALDDGAQIVLSSRAGDAAQFLAPMIHEFKWPSHDWERLGKGLAIGHLMECAGQLTGGFFADPPLKEVPGLDHLGFPIAEMRPNGDAIITKLPGTGGVVSERTCKEQLVYELHDPANYLHNDAVVDFTRTEIRQVGPDRVSITGATGRPPPPTTKIALAVWDGYVAVGRAIYVGSSAYPRAQLAAELITSRIERRLGAEVASALRFDFIGAGAVFRWKGMDPSSLKEIELRVSGRFATQEAASEFLHEVENLSCNGPAGRCQSIRQDYQSLGEGIAFYSAFVPKGAVPVEVREVNLA